MSEAVTRHFYVWCMRCPTRVTITTEAVEPDVEGAAMPPSLDACPMCGSDENASDDDLAARDLWPTAIGSEAWRREHERLTLSDAAAHAAILKARP